MSARARVELGTRTIFNLLGPLSNPAGVRRQVTGVFAKNWVEPLAHVLKNLGCERAWICHGEGGFDEIVPTGVTWIAELKDGKVTSFELTPEDVGLDARQRRRSEGRRRRAECRSAASACWRARKAPSAMPPR